MRTCVVRGTWCVGIVVAVACQARAGNGSTAREFNGPTAFSYVQQQMAFGPRIPNTPGHCANGRIR